MNVETSIGFFVIERRGISAKREVPYPQKRAAGTLLSGPALFQVGENHHD